jgi:hypothetical protein
MHAAGRLIVTNDVQSNQRFNSYQNNSTTTTTAPTNTAVHAIGTVLCRFNNDWKSKIIMMAPRERRLW